MSCWLVFGVISSGTQAVEPPTTTQMTAQIAAAFDAVRADPLRLRVFLAAMPKGGDLHNHLDGAIYAESYLQHASATGLCIDVRAHAIVRPPCRPPLRRADDALAHIPGLGNLMIDALSMRDFRPAANDPSGHDHFFATFGKFEAAADDDGAMLAEEARRAANEHVAYLEIIWYPHVEQALALGRTGRWYPDAFRRDWTALKPRIAALVGADIAATDRAQARLRRILRCGTPAAEPGCGVVLRFQPFSLRTLPPESVFAQIAVNFALVAADRRFVGVNIVAPEDDPVALRDYTLHMRALRFFRQRYPDVKLSLHAGELAFGLVPPEALRFHIREAVEIAGASRIGHGTDVMYEDGSAALLAEMARRDVAVEINQTSNDQILGVRGAEHPFMSYRAAGVPVVLSTDDEGVERIDLTHEYVRAVETWRLDYPELKALARASIRYSFLPGAPLALDAYGAPIAPSAQELAHSEKAAMQWRLERDFERFERTQSRSQWSGRARSARRER
jgi:adenosine deaminase